MLDYELAQLSGHFTRSALVQEPGRTAHWLVEQAYEWIFVKTGLLEWMRNAANQASAPAMAQRGIFATTSAKPMSG